MEWGGTFAFWPDIFYRKLFFKRAIVCTIGSVRIAAVLGGISEKEQENHRILDPDIIDKITSEEELSGLLNLALDGLDRLLKNRDFSYSKNTSEVKEMWIRKSDSFTAFCYDHLEGDFDSSISKKDLRRFFYKYCRNHKLRGASDKGIKITLENLFGVSETQNGDMRERVWEGIQLKNMEVLD